MQKLRAEKGITLIALVITIIVMLILVGVSVTVALKGGLFTTAKKAKEDTATERDKELELSDGKVNINEEEYNSIDEYVNGGSGNGTGGENLTLTPQKETYTVGEEVAIGAENFYVIADDTNKVTLLAKYNLNKEGTAQLNAAYSETACAFSSTDYWSSETFYPINLNDYPVSEGVTSVITTAKTYGTAKGGTGRLMTYEEASALKTNYSGIICGTSIDATDGCLYYWLGTSEYESYVCRVIGVIETVDANGNYSSSIDFGVRPVVEISKANIS